MFSQVLEEFFWRLSLDICQINPNKYISLVCLSVFLTYTLLGQAKILTFDFFVLLVILIPLVLLPFGSLRVSFWYLRSCSLTFGLTLACVLNLTQIDCFKGLTLFLYFQKLSPWPGPCSWPEIWPRLEFGFDILLKIWLWAILVFPSTLLLILTVTLSLPLAFSYMTPDLDLTMIDILISTCPFTLTFWWCKHDLEFDIDL